MDIGTITSVASAVAALIAALYAASSARSAAKSLRYMQMDREDKDGGLHAYLIDGVLWTEPGGKRCIAMACTLTNLASIPNSVAAVELHVYEYQISGIPIHLILRPRTADLKAPWDTPRFSVPINLDARASATGWLSFELPTSFGPHRPIDKCELAFATASGVRVSIEQYLLREREYVRDKS